MTIGARPVPNGSPGNTADAGSWKRATSSTASDPLGGRVASLYPRTRVPRISVPTRHGRLRILKWLTVLVPAVCAGIYETVRHSFLTTDLPNSLGTLIAVLLVVAISFGFARISFGIIQKMEEGLIERNRRLQELSRDAQRVAVLEERDRLAREMHDGIAQVLAYLLVRLDTIESLVDRGRSTEALAELRGMRSSGEVANAEVREAIAGLRTNPAPGIGGLIDALRVYTEDFGARTGIVARFNIDGPVPDGTTAAPELPDGGELHLLRVAQEALTNIRKHARAQRVSVTIVSEGTDWNVRIADDGCGFDPAGALIPEQSGRRHFGLMMMRERIEAMGGKLSITSRPGEGTVIAASVPGVDHGAPDDFELPAPLTDALLRPTSVERTR